MALPGRAQSRLADGGFTVQVSAWRTETEARDEIRRLREKGMAAYWIRANVPGKGIYYRVRFGRFPSRAAATRAAAMAVGQQQVSEFMIAGYETPREETATVMRKSAPAPDPAPVRAPGPVRAHAVTPLPAPPSAPAPTPVIVTGPEPTPEPLRARLRLPIFPVLRAAAAPVPPEKMSPDPALTFSTLVETPPPAPLRAMGSAVAATSEKGIAPAREMAAPAPGAAVAEIVNPAWRLAHNAGPEGRSLRAVSFLNADLGWVADDAGTIAQTTDGGRVWRPLTAIAGLQVTSLQFVSQQVGWALGHRAGATPAEMHLYKTSDGGRVWTETTELPVLREVTRLQFVDERHGWAVGSNAMLLRTENGGDAWTAAENLEQLLGAPLEGERHNFGFSDAHFLNAGTGWAVGNFYGRARTNIGSLLTTRDGGRTWRRIPLPLQALAAQAQSMTGRLAAGQTGAPPVSRGTSPAAGRIIPGALQSVRFTDENNGVVTGEMNDGNRHWLFVLRTHDGGRNWQPSLTPAEHPAGPLFISPQHGWLAAPEPAADPRVRQTRVLRTDDGGARWDRDLTLRDARIHQIFFLSPAYGWAVGDHGVVLRYVAPEQTPGH